MLKRSTKLTALFVAAAAVASIVPATAADRLGTKDGTVTRGFAYGDGSYVYDGYRTDDDDASLYYNNGGKDKEIDDNDDYELDEESPVFYGTKYVMVKDDGDDYLLDLSNGKIDDDESVQDKYDNAKSKLYTNLKKADRYSYSKDSKNKDEAMSNDNFKQILKGKRGEVWYQYTALGDTTAAAATADPSTTSAGVTYTGFANESGSKYVDICQDANLYVLIKDGSKLKTIKLSEYDKENDGVKARFVSTTPIAQDKDYIYTITTVDIFYKDTQAMPVGISTQQKFLQKISKAQGEKEDGAYKPKSTTSYQLDQKDLYNDGDIETASKILLDAEGEFDIVNYEVKNSVLYATGVKSGKVKVWAIKLKKGKYDTNVAGEPVTKNVDTYVAIKDDDFDHDAVGDTVSETKLAYSIDVDGNTWVLDKGKIFKSTGSDFKEMYTCDRALDRIDVYDENNLIIWENDGDVYTTVQEGKNQTKQDAGVTDEQQPITTTVGWNKNADGTWSFYDATGAKVTAKWVNLGGTWYYLKADGIMATGWLQEGGNWYFLNNVSDGFLGAMKTGWINDGGTWYYLNASGAMKTGWFQDSDGKWYFLKSSGAMAVNETIDGYYLGANGAWVK